MKRVVCLFVMISAMLLSSQMVKADELYKSTYFSGTAHNDHFSVSLLIADLHGRDTWVDRGYLKAYDKDNSARSIDIANVYTWDQDGNDLAHDQGMHQDGWCHRAPEKYGE